MFSLLLCLDFIDVAVAAFDKEDAIDTDIENYDEY